jgi:5-methylcytosine-specific restriction endonuclease McrA
MALYSLGIKCKKKIPYRTVRCDKCQKEYNKLIESRKDEKLSNFYRCYRWQKVRKEVLKEHNHLCYTCKLVFGNIEIKQSGS